MGPPHGIAMLAMHSDLLKQAFEELERQRKRAEAERSAFHQAATTGDVIDGEWTDITDQKQLTHQPGDDTC